MEEGETETHRDSDYVKRLVFNSSHSINFVDILSLEEHQCAYDILVKLLTNYKSCGILITVTMSPTTVDNYDNHIHHACYLPHFCASRMSIL